MRNGELQIFSVNPFLDVPALHAAAFIQPVGEAAQERFIVVTEPAGGTRAQKIFDHSRRHLGLVDGTLARRGGFRDRFSKILKYERGDKRLRVILIHLPVPRAQQTHRFCEVCPPLAAPFVSLHHSLREIPAERRVHVLLHRQRVLGPQCFPPREHVANLPTAVV